MDLKVISELIKMVSDSKLTSLEVESKEMRVKLEKNYSHSDSKSYRFEREYETSNEFDKYDFKPEVPVERSIIEDKDDSFVEKAIDSSSSENFTIVKSPIVGTFYSAASPESEAFATVGKKVKKGDTLCIVEAMKLMNEIESEFDGEIVEILVQNGAMVEYGQPLFKLK